jgi:hypothetical protein
MPISEENNVAELLSFIFVANYALKIHNWEH